jgi:hypothetical protein
VLSWINRAYRVPDAGISITGIERRRGPALAGA